MHVHICEDGEGLNVWACWCARVHLHRLYMCVYIYSSWMSMYIDTYTAYTEFISVCKYKGTRVSLSHQRDTCTEIYINAYKYTFRHMWTHMCIHMPRTRICIYVYTHTHIYIYMLSLACVCICICIYTHRHTHTYTHTHTHTLNTYTNKLYIYIYMYIYIYTHTHTYMHTS